MAKSFSIAILRRLLGGVLLTVLGFSANAASLAAFDSKLFEAGTRQRSPGAPSVGSTESFLRQRALTNPRAPKIAADSPKQRTLKLSLIHAQLVSRFLGAPKSLTQRRAVV